MLNFLVVLFGGATITWLLFVRRPSARKILSASRWMLFAWGLLILVHIASPIRYLTFRLSLSTWLYCGLWLGAFLLADNVRFSIFSNGTPNRPRHCEEPSSRAMGMICLLAFVGMLVLAYQGRTVTSADEALLAALRDAQLEGAEGGFLKTLATVLACSGLVVALTDISGAILRKSRIPLRALIGLLSYLSVTLFTAGRPGIVLGTLSVFTVVVASNYLSGTGRRNLKPMIITAVLLAAIGGGYIAAVVSTRTTGWVGGMDNKIELMNSMEDSALESGFRESLRPAGVLGDTIVESFYYLSPQLYGLEFSIDHYRGPLGWGAIEFPYIARRLEGDPGSGIFELITDADSRTFEDAGVSPHFFQTAVRTTSLDFGHVLGLCFVFLCGVLSRRSRLRALQTRSPFAIGCQALLCSGAAWSIILSPFAEQSWSFPLLWFVGIQFALAPIQSFIAVLSHSMYESI
jgi:hypothetical protein